MKSEIDFTDLSNSNEEQDEANEDTKADRKTSISTEENDKSSNENQKDGEEELNKPEEEEKMLKQLESSSKGKVKGSLILHYFKSADRPFSFILLIICFLLAQISASFSDVWVANW